MKYRSIILYTTGVTLLFVGIFLLIDFFFGEFILSAGRNLVAQWGWVALFFTFAFAAIVIIPFPDHAVSAFALIGGMGDGVNVVASTSGSVIGAVFAYFLGASLRHSRVVNNALQRHIEKWQPVIKQHGFKALAVSALTPAPFSPACWISGILQFSFFRFLLVVFVCRLLKIIIFLALLRLGLISF